MSTDLSDNERLTKELEDLRKEVDTLKKNRAVLEASLRKTEIKDQVESGFNMQQVAVFRSCYPERRGTPRQGGVVASALGVIRLDKDVYGSAILEGITEFSHIWVVFVFHENTNLHRRTKVEGLEDLEELPAKRSKMNESASKVKSEDRQPRFKGLVAKVAPPRLAIQNGKTQKVGVFACRTPHRPNPIGLSLVEVVRIEEIQLDGQERRVDLIVRGADLIDGTPVLDLKPYVPSFDSQPQATAAQWVSASAELPTLELSYSDEANRDKQQLQSKVQDTFREQKQLVRGYKKSKCERIAQGDIHLACYPYSSWEDVLHCAEESLKLDIRAPHQREKTKEGDTNGEDFEGIFRFHGLEIKYRIIFGSMCAIVERIQLCRERLCSQASVEK